MNLMRKFFKGIEDEKQELSLAITVTPKTVVLKGQKWFDIFEDGNGKFRAQHTSGKWLLNSTSLTGLDDFAKTYNTLEECQKSAIYYVNSQQLKKVGSIEFIPFSEDH